MKISQGTISVLIGCHSPIHSLLVLLAWKKLCGYWPMPWQIICIFLHDIGHWGKNYLDDYEQKRLHWIAGANFANRLFGWKGYVFVASHDINSVYIDYGCPMYRSDKYSWSIAPSWWQWMNCIAEPKLRVGYSIKEATRMFRDQVNRGIESGLYPETHSFYLDRCKK